MEDTSHTAHIQQVIESLSAPQAGSASLPTSPIRVTPGFVQSRVSSLDSLATSSRTGSLSLLTAQPTGQASNSPSLTTQASSQSARSARPSVSASRRGIQRARSASAAPRRTRQSVYQGLRSPPQEVQTHRRASQLNRRTLAAPAPIALVIMAQVNIPEAGRLNPRQRQAGGVSDTLVSLGFPVLDTADIPIAGKNVLRQFVPLRTTVVENANLVFTDASNLAACKAILTEYIDEVKEYKEMFNGVLVTMVEEVANAEQAIGEMIKFERELKGLRSYCSAQLVARPAHMAAAGNAEGIKLERLCFPHYDGETNFRAFKTEFQSLADRRVGNDEEKRTYIKKSLQGKAQEYIHKYATHATTYTQMWDMLS